MLRALERRGQRGDTVVIFTTDHGDHLGDHRLMLKGAEQYQSIVRVPFIWSDPQAPARAARTDALGSTIDIPAHHARPRAGSSRSRGMQGEEPAAACADGKAGARQRVHPVRPPASEPGLDNVPPRVHTLIDERYRCQCVPRHRLGRTLRSARTDPGEFDNLWDVAAHAATRARMVEKLALTEIEHVDRVPLPTRRA